MRLIVSSPAEVWQRLVSLQSTDRTEPAPHATEPFQLTPLQEEGAARAAHVIAHYSGVIIADTVGMGKTFIALRLISRAVAVEQDVIVVTPAALRAKWQRALPSRNDAVVVSHSRLPRRDVVSGLRRNLRCDCPLIVVDEAHQFRNPRTARYRALSDLAPGAQVVLLTATPINNRLADLYWLLRLFLGDGDLRRSGVPDLRDALLTADKATLGIAQRIVSQVVIRRTRADLPVNTMKTEYGFPQRSRPRPVRYELAECYPRLQALAPILERLPLAPFRLMHYTTAAGAPQGTATLVKIGLIKRLESSARAFQLSVDRLLRLVELSADAERSGGFLQARDALHHEPLQLSLTALIARPLPAHTDRERLRADLMVDCMLLRQLRDAATSERDPKAERLEHLLQKLGPSPRVVFTQYVETAEHLFNRLRRSRVAVLHGSKAALASGPISRRAVLERFAPVAMGAPQPAPHERINTLICTDVLSEGLDLQDAQYCISYDLPWNPVRLMQRVGRIDRMQSPHERVYSWYFMPHDTIEGVLQLLLRLRRKIRTIEGSIGPDATVLARPQRRPKPPMDSSKSGNIWQRLEAAGGSLPVSNSERATVVARVHSTCISLRIAILGLRVDGFGWWEAIPMNEASATHPTWSQRRIARLLLALHDEGMVAASSEHIQEAVECVLARRTPSATSPGKPTPCGAAARQIWTRLSRIPGGAPPDLCVTADRVLRRLRDGLPMAQECALGALLRSPETADLRAMLSEIDRIIGQHPRRRQVARITAVLLVEGVGAELPSHILTHPAAN